MSLVRFRTKQPVGTIWDDLFNRDFFDSSLGSFNDNQVPAVNVKETNEGFSIEVAVPGYSKDDFNVTVEDSTLTIASEKKVEHTEEDKGYTRKEFSFQSFKRSFTLPESADGSKISGAYENGILTISIPKREEAKALPARTVKIK